MMGSSTYKKYAILQDLQNDYLDQLLKPKHELPLNVRQAITCIHSYLFAQELTVGWIKQRCNIHAKTFSTEFALYKELTPKQYILHHRLRAGKMMMENAGSGIPITAIALSIGFNSLSAYCHSFKDKNGISPLKWRDGINT